MDFKKLTAIISLYAIN